MKLHNLTLENFRSFDRYTINHLGRVNLLVGTNNSGKTSILEAAYLLTRQQVVAAIWQTLFKRGEYYVDRIYSEPLGHEIFIDIRSIFRGFAFNSYIPVKLESNNTWVELTVKPRPYLPGEAPDLSSGLGLLLPESNQPLSLHVRRGFGSTSERDTVTHREIPLRGDGGLSTNGALLRDPSAIDAEVQNPSNLVMAASISSREVASLYKSIILTEAEDLIVEALQMIDPAIDRIAPAASNGHRAAPSARDGILVRLKGHKEPISIASMGDGIWRMLGLALAVVQSKDGILLIDEVDTGLHYSVMGQMWRFLSECSRRFNVQIIATTHSRDCYQSLAEICDADRKDPSEITMQRIDRKRDVAVSYSEAAIIAAAENDVEVR